jgi:Ca2+-binding EF-hand superfamily protein
MADKTDSSVQREPLINSTTLNNSKLKKSVSLNVSTNKNTSQLSKGAKSKVEKKKPIREDLSIDQIDELFESFSLFDKDYDGAISSDELSNIMKSIGLNATDSEIKEMVDEADTVKQNLIFIFLLN